jgi:hypothetical protein
MDLLLGMGLDHSNALYSMCCDVNGGAVLEYADIGIFKGYETLTLGRSLLCCCRFSSC